MHRLPLAALALALLAGCRGEPPEETPSALPGAAPSQAEAPPPNQRIYERNLVLVVPDADSLLVAAWLFGSGTRDSAVDRSARVLLLRGETWETLYDDDWTTPPMRDPWRVVPHQQLRILVGMEDALERVVLADPARMVELALAETLTEWSGPRGGTYRVMEGSMIAGESRAEGLLLDMARSSGPDERQYGDWAFLVSGDSLQVVLHSPTAEPPGSGAWRGWARLDFRELRWPVLTMEWPEVRAFEPARRDVPVAWRVTAPDAEVTVELTASGARLEAGEGEGARLPVSGLFGTTGTLTFEGNAYPVRGLVRHVQR